MVRRAVFRSLIRMVVRAALAAAASCAVLACGDGASAAADAGTCVVDEPDGCPSWTKDVQPIIEARCYGCHGPGGIEQSYRDFTTYQGVSGAGTTLATDVLSCKMPPPDAGQPTPRERGALVTWIECGAPKD